MLRVVFLFSVKLKEIGIAGNIYGKTNRRELKKIFDSLSSWRGQTSAHEEMRCGEVSLLTPVSEALDDDDFFQLHYLTSSCYLFTWNVSSGILICVLIVSAHWSGVNWTKLAFISFSMCITLESIRYNKNGSCGHLRVDHITTYMLFDCQQTYPALFLCLNSMCIVFIIMKHFSSWYTW